MKHRLHLLFVFGFALAGCTDNSQLEAKVDRLQAKFDLLGQILQMQDELHKSATPSVCVLTDIARAQQVSILGTARPIAVGETIFVGDDIWRVDAVKHFTEEVPEKLRNAKVQKLYRVSSTELLVTFQGKAKKAPNTEEPRKEATEK